VFDDPSVGLSQEPFVAGADTMIDRVVADIPDAEKGFTMIFSSTHSRAISFGSNGGVLTAKATGTTRHSWKWRVGSVQRFCAIFPKRRKSFMCR
jgi:hypothetical protein